MTGVTARERVVGTGSDGRTVTEIVLDNGRVRAAVCSYGATLWSVRVPDVSGIRRELVLGMPSLADYEAVTERAYVGSTMGRFARIVSDGHLVIDGREHQLARNAGPHHIHGGSEGFDARTWSAHPETAPGRARAVLTLRSPDGDQGYPGALDVSAVFELDDRDRLTVTYTATTDAPTLCGLSTHVFWNLGTAPTIDGHRLRLVPDRQLVADEAFVPTGEMITLRPQKAGMGLRDVRIDACLVDATRKPESVDTELARLSDPIGGIGLAVRSDQSAMAVYTGDHLPGQPRAGMCLQPGPWPDAPNRPDFPSAVLRPGETYSSRTTFALLVPTTEDDLPT